MSEDSGQRWKKVIIISLIILGLIIVLITAVIGISGLMSFFKWLIGILLFLTIIFFVLYLFWYLFIKKTYQDVPANYKKKLLKTAKLMKNKMTGDLYLSGDTKHNRVKLGQYAYLRIELPKQNRVERPNTDKNSFQKIVVEETTTRVPVDCFVLIQKGMIDKLFGDAIFLLVKPEDHDYSSIFNDVTIKGFNLVPLDSQFFTIDNRNLDVDIIKGMSTNYIREVVYEIFRDLDRLVKQAIDLDQGYQKERKRNLEYQMPMMQGLIGANNDDGGRGGR